MSRTRRIIQEYFSNSHPEQIRKNFASWLQIQKNREEKDEILLEIWNGLHIEADELTEKSYRKLQSRIAARTHRKHHSFIYRLSGAAAILLIPLLSVAFTYFYLKQNAPAAEEHKWVEYMVPQGEMRNIVLPDSSQICLNAGSILIYPQQFGKTRSVYLNGEAYFSVVRNEDQPFVVNTVDMEIEVLGTVFNISSYTDSETSSATLESGKINVQFKKGDKEPVILSPNERISYCRNSGGIEKRTVNVNHFTAWTKGNINIQSMTIGEIAKTIERRYAMNVYINSQKYENERITMKLTNKESLNEFMEILQFLLPGLQYKIEKDKLYIK